MEPPSSNGAEIANPLPYPTGRAEIVRTFRQPWGRIWLRVVARLMEWASDLQPKQLNYSQVTPQLAVGGAFHSRQIRLLRARGVTAVVDCREEARDDPELLARQGISFLHVPTADRYGFTYEQLRQGVDWVVDHLASGGQAFLHCEHGVGRGPLMACAVLIAQGHSAAEALRVVRSGRWQAMPNDRQLRVLLDFEREWRRYQPAAPTPDAATTKGTVGPPHTAAGLRADEVVAGAGEEPTAAGAPSAPAADSPPPR